MADELISIALYAEDETGARGAKLLGRRVALELVDWLDDDVLDDVIVWRGVEPGQGWTPLRRTRDLAKMRGIKVHGKFSGNPDDSATRKLLRLALHDGAAVVVIARDLDGDHRRKDGFRAASAGRAPPAALAWAQPEAEAWLLATWRPTKPGDVGALAAATSRLGFDPTRHIERLTSTHRGGARDAKRLAADLIPPEDRWRGLESLSLHNLRRLSAVGIASYIDDVEVALRQALRSVGGIERGGRTGD